MSNRNLEHLAIDPDDPLYWVFALPSDAEGSEKHVAEITTVARAVIEAGGEFWTPTELSFHVDRYAEERQFPFDVESAERLERTHEQLADDDGISADSLEAAVDDALSGPARIPRISFDRNQIRVQLADGEYIADRSSRCVAYRSGEPLDREPSWDPLNVTISHARNFDHPSIDAEYVYQVAVELRSDIWFEPTDIGETNREHLAAFLGRIGEAIPYEEIRREPERGLEYELVDIF